LLKKPAITILVSIRKLRKETNSLQFGKEAFLALARKSMGCAEAYIIWSFLSPALAGSGTASGHGQVRDSVETSD
jgi:hypothetical protein